MSDLHWVQCNKCGVIGICTQNITGEKHRLTEYVDAKDFRLYTDAQKALAKDGKLAWVQLCGTWVKASMEMSKGLPIESVSSLLADESVR